MSFAFDIMQKAGRLAVFRAQVFIAVLPAAPAKTAGGPAGGISPRPLTDEGSPLRGGNDKDWPPAPAVFSGGQGGCAADLPSRVRWRSLRRRTGGLTGVRLPRRLPP